MAALRRRAASCRWSPLITKPLPEARLALAGDARNIDAPGGEVPPQLRTDPGLAFAEQRASGARTTRSPDAAAQLLLAHADNPVRPAAWWG